MFFLYSLLLTLVFILMSPLFLFRREKYAAGFRQRLGYYPKFKHDGRPVIWLHCVSVGETNAARPLVDKLVEEFSDHRLVFSTTTRTGQELAQKIFHEKADAVVYFPFDWKFSVRKAIANHNPSLILLMETEIWPRFIREAKLSGAKIAIVNGRLSEKSFTRYSTARPFIKRVLTDIDLALMQDEADARRIVSLGIDSDKVKVTGNLKFDISNDPKETDLTRILDLRFEISNGRPLIVAASTHKPEEKLILDVFDNLRRNLLTRPRLLIAPRHTERFDEVADLIKEYPLSYVRCSENQKPSDTEADIILLDSIGELRSVYPLAKVVFVGGSITPHGGQSMLEPALSGRAIIIGPFTHNFTFAVEKFLSYKALVQMKWEKDNGHYVESLINSITRLLEYPVERDSLGKNARTVMEFNRGATKQTIKYLKPLLQLSKIIER